jgi:hypothetical protein
VRGGAPSWAHRAMRRCRMASFWWRLLASRRLSVDSGQLKLGGLFNPRRIVPMMAEIMFTLCSYYTILGGRRDSGWILIDGPCNVLATSIESASEA